MDKKPKRTNKPKNTTFYLGKDEREARLRRIDQIASEYGVTRSILLQKIADGELAVVPTKQAS